MSREMFIKSLQENNAKRGKNWWAYGENEEPVDGARWNESEVRVKVIW
jgi:hypothetical protein